MTQAINRLIRYENCGKFEEFFVGDGFPVPNIFPFSGGETPPLLQGNSETDAITVTDAIILA
jgi:hypothetical protein